MVDVVEMECYYCSHTLPADGDTDRPMLTCSKCTDSFHQQCIPTMQAWNYEPLKGDDLYQFTCLDCGNGKESIQRLHLGWADMAHIALFHLSNTVLPALTGPVGLKFYTTKQIYTLVEANVHHFLETLNIVWISRSIAEAMKSNKKRFTSSYLRHGKCGSWALNVTEPASTFPFKLRYKNLYDISSDGVILPAGSVKLPANSNPVGFDDNSSHFSDGSVRTWLESVTNNSIDNAKRNQGLGTKYQRKEQELIKKESDTKKGHTPYNIPQKRASKKLKREGSFPSDQRKIWVKSDSELDVATAKDDDEATPVKPGASLNTIPRLSERQQVASIVAQSTEHKKIETPRPKSFKQTKIKPIKATKQVVVDASIPNNVITQVYVSPTTLDNRVDPEEHKVKQMKIELMQTLIKAGKSYDEVQAYFLLL